MLSGAKARESCRSSRAFNVNVTACKDVNLTAFHHTFTFGRFSAVSTPQLARARSCLISSFQVSKLSEALETSEAPRGRSAETHRCRQTLQGSFSAVSKRNFARKYAFESSRRDNELLCTALQSQSFVNNFANKFAECCKIRQKSI